MPYRDKWSATKESNSTIRSSGPGIVSVFKKFLFIFCFMNESSANGYATTDNMAESAQKLPSTKISHPKNANMLALKYLK